MRLETRPPSPEPESEQSQSEVRMGPFIDTSDGSEEELPAAKRRRLREAKVSEESDIDGTSSDNSDFQEDEPLEVKTPPVNPVSGVATRKTLVSPGEPRVPSLRLPAPLVTQPDHGRDASHSPELDDGSYLEYAPFFDKAAKMSMEKIVSSRDSLLLMTKIIIRLGQSELRDLSDFLQQYLVPTYKDLVDSALKAMKEDRQTMGADDPVEDHLSMRMGAIYICWHNCVSMKTAGIHMAHIHNAISAIHLEKNNMFPVFFGKLKALCSACIGWRQAHDIEDTEEDSEPPELGDTEKIPRRRRFFLPKTSRDQKKAQKRQEKQEKAREALRLERQLKGLSNDDPAGQAVTFKEPAIYLHPSIGEFVKPHQLNGIQFMWRELCDADKPQGCLLAHVMGLGKTMQVYVSYYLPLRSIICLCNA